MADLQTSVDLMATFTTSSIRPTKTVFSSTQRVTRVAMTPSQNASQNSNSSYSLTTVAIVLIAVSGAAVGITGIAIPCYLWRKRKNKRFEEFLTFLSIVNWRGLVWELTFLSQYAKSSLLSI